MSIQRVKNKIIVAKEPGTIFASANTSNYIELNNYQYIDFIVSSGVGTTDNVTFKLLGKKGSNTPVSLPFYKKTETGFVPVSANGDVLSVGGTTGACGFAIYRIDADKLAAEDCDRVAISNTALASSTVPGEILAQLYVSRYSE